MQRLRTMSLAAVCLAAATLTGAADSAPLGHLVLNGGGSKPDEVMETFIGLAGGRDASIVVFPTASEQPDTGQYYVDLFVDDYDCTDVWVAEVARRDDALDEELAARVAAADGVWFAGGDQRRITAALLDTAVGEAVRSVHLGGGVVGGTSAGTACQSDLMITGDGDFTRILADNVVLTEGLSLFGGVIVDQHFVARQRQNRLVSVVLEHPDRVGVGVDEATAVWVRPDGSFKVLGDGWVVVYDAADAVIQRRPYATDDTALGAHGLSMSVLLPGEVYDVPTRRLLPVDPWAPVERGPWPTSR